MLTQIIVDLKTGMSKEIPLTDAELLELSTRPVVLPTADQLRIAEYPPITDFIEAYAADDKIGLQTYKDKCLAVIAKYPKPPKTGV